MGGQAENRKIVKTVDNQDARAKKKNWNFPKPVDKQTVDNLHARPGSDVYRGSRIESGSRSSIVIRIVSRRLKALFPKDGARFSKGIRAPSSSLRRRILDTRPPLSTKAFLDAILDRGDPAKRAAFVAAITGRGDPVDTAALAAALTGKKDPVDTAAFAAALKGNGDYHPREPRDDLGRPTKSLTYQEWINTVKYGILHPLTAAEFVAAITGEGGPSRTDPFAPATLGEAGYNPEEPRDERGRWTTDGSRAGPMHTVSYSGPGNSPDESGGKEIDAKDSTKAARDIKDFIGASAILRAKLKEAAKGTDKVERGGVLMHAVDPTTKPPYKFVEEKSKENTESSCQIKTGKDGFLPEVPPNGTLDADHLAGKELDKRYRVIATWHTHPPFPRGDAQPSGKDVESSYKNEPGIGIQRWPAAGDKPERYDVWMTDENRGYFHVGEWQGDK